MGGSLGSITSSYSLADVTGYSISAVSGIGTYAGGLVGGTGGKVSASYAAGAVSANTVNQNYGAAKAGGLVGDQAGNVSASYARGDVSSHHDATAISNVSGTSYAGGLVGGPGRRHHGVLLHRRGDGDRGRHAEHGRLGGRPV